MSGQAIRFSFGVVWSRGAHRVNGVQEEGTVREEKGVRLPTAPWRKLLRATRGVQILI